MLGNWINYRQIDIDNTKIDTTLSHFPVVLKLNSSSGLSSKDVTFIFDELGANKLKIAIFQSDQSTQLYAEIEKWDAVAEEAIIHISRSGWDISSSADTVIYFAYDSTQSDNTTYISDVPGSNVTQNVWDSDFEAIYHMNDYPDSDNITDSTGNVDGVKGASDEPTETTGKIGDCQNFDGGDVINLGTGSFNIPTGFLSVLIKPASYPSTENPIFCQDGVGHTSGDFFVWMDNTAYCSFGVSNGVSLPQIKSNSPFSIDTWYHVGFQFGTGGIKMYVDNVLQTATDALTNGLTNTAVPTEIGARVRSIKYFDGDIDELRISSIQRPVEWIKVEYHSAEDSLITWGNEVISPLEVTTEIETNRTHNSARLNADIVSLGESTEVEAYFQYWKDESSPSINTTSKQIKSTTGTFYVDITGLDNNTTYKFKAIVDDTDSASGAGSDEGLELSFTTKDLESQSIGDTVTVTDSIETSLTLIEEINETINITDVLIHQFNQELAETVNVTDLTSPTIPITRTGTAQYASKIIHTNPLIVVCNTNPVQIAKIDITSWTEPGWVVYTLDDTGEDYANALDVCVNETFDKVYVACANGKIAEIDLNDFDVRTEIDVTETEQLNHIACVDDLKVIFVATEASTKELIKIDDATTVKVNTDFRFLQRIITKVKTMFHYIVGKAINTDFRYLSEILTKLSTDFRYTLADYDAITPISRTDFAVTVGGTTLPVGDIVLDSINVRWIAEEPSTASFTLARYHDKLNYTIDNVNIPITSNQAVVVTLNDREIFTGKIETVDASGVNERVNISCKGTIRHPFYNTSSLPLCGVSERRHLYHIIDNNVNIIKEVDDYRPEGEEPTIYKGIKVDLGIAEWENIFNIGKVALSFDGTTWSNYIFASQRLDRTGFEQFIPGQNKTYFWFLDAYNWATNIRVGDKYLGTSLTGLSDGLWDMSEVSYIQQRIFPNSSISLGYYTVGNEPYQEISVKNGSYLSRRKWEDRSDGLYEVLGEHWDFTGYARAVANVEYEKLKDVNGDIGTATSSSIDITMDALLYYNFGLLTKINISNTTEAGIYLDNNGFPIRIKEVNIDASSMKTTLTLDNQRTEAELEDIDNTQYPSEPFKWLEISSKRAFKYDINRGEDVL